MSKENQKKCAKDVDTNIAEGGGWTNRANSGNYVLSEGFGTVLHEVLHLMGFPMNIVQRKTFFSIG